MFKRKSQILCLWFLLWDLSLTGLAWVGAYWLRFLSGWFPVATEATDIPRFGLCLSKIPLLLILAAFAYRFTGQYRIHRFRRFREELVSVIKGSALMGLLVIAASFS